MWFFCFSFRIFHKHSKSPKPQSVDHSCLKQLPKSLFSFPTPQLSYRHKYWSAVVYMCFINRSTQNTNSSSTVSSKQKQTTPLCYKRCQQPFTFYAPFWYLCSPGYLSEAFIVDWRLVLCFIFKSCLLDWLTIRQVMNSRRHKSLILSCRSRLTYFCVLEKIS